MEHILITVWLMVSTFGLMSAFESDQNTIKCGETLNISKQAKYIIRYQTSNIYDVTLPPTSETENHTVKIVQYEEGGLRFRRCRVEVRTLPGYRLQVNVHYIPQYPDCNRGYFHIGNDKFRLDMVSLTSYKFCDVVRGLEIISRENYMWMVYNALSQQETTGEIHIEARPAVRCSSDSFGCSPVQCVEQTRVCDGRTDCQNGRDEFCGNIRNVTEKQIPETNGPCFLCWNDRVICPSLPMYNDERGYDLWFMCDGVDHCKDGSDEQLDMCYRMKRKGTSSMLFQCIPRLDGGYHGNTSVRIWRDRVCDGVVNCRNREDEEKCSEENLSGKMDIDPVSVTFVVCFLMSVISGAAIFIYRTGKKQSVTIRLDSLREGPALDRSETVRLETVTEEPEVNTPREKNSLV